MPGTSAVFDLNADLGAAFYDLPYPSDLRLSASGGPDLTGMPVSAGLAETMLGAAQDRPGFPMIPAAYFRF
ncbi:MAG TPA: hypothetical protein VFB62_12060, partial [Polyangiaceae bacterium]|nr:hypothetical protein [Polyangiaceae bacterium]